MNGSVRRLAALACAAAAVALTGGPAATAARFETRTVCSRTHLQQSTGVAAVPGPVVRRGDRVIVVRYVRRHRWAFVVARNGQGWIRGSALCRRRR